MFQRSTLVFAILATGFCGMVAEFSVSTVVGYLIGNTPLAYSLTIATFMLAMGLGAYFSENVEKGEMGTFLVVEVVLSIVAASSTIFITQAARVDLTWEAALFTSVFIGSLVGFEIPLLMRINEKRGIILKKNASRVFMADYVGSFVAGLVYCTVLLPKLGAVNTPILGGVVNLVVAICMLVAFADSLPKFRLAGAMAFAVVVTSGFYGFGERIVFDAEQSMYEDLIVHSEQTPYQKIVLTRGGKTTDHCLYLNGNTQFCEVDEHIYHESLVHPAFALNPYAKNILVLGGGDGNAIREVLKYGDVNVTLVDLDPRMVEFSRTHPVLSRINQGSFDDSRVTTIAADAYSWVKDNDQEWDIIIIDLPDPSRAELAKMYSVEFYRAVRDILTGNGVMVTQSTSPIHATKPFVIIWKTMKTAGFSTVPYKANVPTFGEWGWNIGMKRTFLNEDEIKQRLRAYHPDIPTSYLNNSAVQASLLFQKGIFPEDMETIVASRLMRPTVVSEYERSWNKYD